jgi:hypothetical protein
MERKKVEIGNLLQKANDVYNQDKNSAVKHHEMGVLMAQAEFDIDMLPFILNKFVGQGESTSRQGVSNTPAIMGSYNPGNSGNFPAFAHAPNAHHSCPPFQGSYTNAGPTQYSSHPNAN